MCKTAVFAAGIPETEEFLPVYPPERQAEIERYSNSKVRREKYYVWRLLEYALDRCLGLDIRKLRFEKNEKGKWTSDGVFFSLSHTDGVVAVAVSEKNVGVDVEVVRRHRDGLEKKILTGRELNELFALDGVEAEEYVIKRWTQKESIFKTLDRSVFEPSSLETADFPVRTEVVELLGRKYMLSVCAEDADGAEFAIYDDVF